MMEINRVTSENVFSFNNLLKEILFIYLKCYLSYMIILYSKIYYEKISRSLKNNLSSFLFEILTILLATFYSFIVIYILHLNNFLSLKENVFELWSKLYRTDSNLRDYNSFKMFYCQSNFYNKINENGEDDDISYADSVRHMCKWTNIIDSYYFEYLLMVVLVVPQIISSARLCYSNNARHNDEVSIKAVIDDISLVLIKVFYCLIFFYFIFLYSSIYRNYNSLKISYSSVSEKVSQSNNEINDIKSETTKEEGSKITFFDVLKVVFEVLVEIF